MTDLRDALRRASGLGSSESVDHGAVAEKTQRVIRRRRAMYAAGSALFVLVVGFSSFQIAEGNWLGRTSVERDGGVASDPKADHIVLRVEPQQPTSDDNIVVTMSNATQVDLVYGDEYTLEKRTDDGWEDVTDTFFYPKAYYLDPGEEVRAAALGVLQPGHYRVTKEVGVSTYRISFRVTSSPEAKLDPIELETPRMDDDVSSPVTVSGTADVYEGTVTIVVRDQFGEILAETFTTATCGTGCRGDFSAEVPFEVDEEQQGSIEVYSESAENGEPMFGKTARVTLLPSDERQGEETPSEEERAAIEVLSPTQDALAVSPLTVSGTANTFEANVRIRILDENGKTLADTFTTATCGTGCRGDYVKRVRFSVDREQPGLVQVFEESAENGDPINMVEIPVTLLPG